MLERQVVIPASPDQLWNALTDPESLAAWFGSEVEWDLCQGGAARFVDDDGTVRRGIVDAVFPGRHLSFVWWREGDGAGGASQVSYVLEPEDEGSSTRLTVTEQPLSAAPVASASASYCGHEWSDWDGRLLRCLAQSGAGADLQVARR